MAGIERIENAEARAYQRFAWRLERAGWVAFLLIIAAALAGLTGRGPLSAARAGHPGDPLWVDYQRFARNDSPTPLVVHLGRGDEFWIDAAYLEAIEVESVMPTPAAMRVAGERVFWRFSAPAEGGLKVQVRTRPEGPGVLQGRFGVQVGPEAGGSEVRVKQFVFP